MSITVNMRELSNDGLVKIIRDATLELHNRSKIPDKQSVKLEPVPHDIRKEAIKLAKNAIFELKDNHGRYKVHSMYTNVEFKVNKYKRTVVALLRGVNSGKVRSTGIAKCDPNDVFNIHIGKAIALYRALGITVPQQLLSVTQPEVVEVGDILKFKSEIVDTSYEVLSLSGENNLKILTCSFKGLIGQYASSSPDWSWAKIVDDSK